MARLAADTSLLIDLQRERRRSIIGPAQTFLQSHTADEIVLPVIAFGEFVAGFSDPNDPAIEALTSGFLLLPMNTEVAWRYREIYRPLRERGLLIGANDLWIAATALASQLPLITRNVGEYSRVPGLEVLSY
jgi:tRNA(fMet)-specific endonuclease VapC